MSLRVRLCRFSGGGFTEPTVKQAVEIVDDNGQGITITQSTLKPESKTDYHVQSGNASYDEINSLKRALDQIIDLPMEEPTGSQDIYGQGISLSIDMDGFQWSNQIPEGCSEGESSIQATDEQKKTFRELVDLVTYVGQQYAITVQ